MNEVHGETFEMRECALDTLSLDVDDVLAGKTMVLLTFADAGRVEGLSDWERERAAAFTNDLARSAFVTGRALVRQVVSRMEGCSAKEVEIGISDSGKPYLIHKNMIGFSISHTLQVVAAAFSVGDVGLDIERTDRERPWLAMAQRYFPAEEAAMLERAAIEERCSLFTRLWVAREAALKCHGTGLAGYLDKTRCTLENGKIREVAVGATTYETREFQLAGGIKGAVARKRFAGPLCIARCH